VESLTGGSPFHIDALAGAGNAGPQPREHYNMEHMQRGAHARRTFACSPRSSMQVLCNTDDWITDALRMKSIFKSADRYGSRAVSANQNGWVQKLVGPKTPLDVQGFDYSTDKYDEWHLQVCPPKRVCFQQTEGSIVNARHAGARRSQHLFRDQQRSERQGRVSICL
jgi:hypothetical protein